MSILAEPRRKQRLSIDPQNLQWKDDKQKFSRRLMERMGWSDGDGLGRNRQGHACHLRPKANHSGRGLGADKLPSYDSTWIAHHEDFADLLNSLNKLKEQDSAGDEDKEDRSMKVSLELNSRSLRRRIHYQKFTRSKDITNYSPNDRTAVMGIGLSRTKPESSQKTIHLAMDGDKNDVLHPPSNTTVSTVSVEEYFAAKMAALKAKRELAESETKEDKKMNVSEMSVIEDQIGKGEINERKKKKKELRRQKSLQCQIPKEACEEKIENFEEEDPSVEAQNDESERRKRKKELKQQKKKQLRIENGLASGMEMGCEDYETAEFTPDEKKGVGERAAKNEDKAVAPEEIIYKAKKKKRKSEKL